MEDEQNDREGRDRLVSTGIPADGGSIDTDSGVDEPPIPQTTKEDPLRAQILEKAKTGKPVTAAALSSNEHPAKTRIRDDLLHQRQMDMDARMMGLYWRGM